MRRRTGIVRARRVVSLALLPLRVSRLGPRRADRIRLLALACAMPLLQQRLARRRGVRVRVSIHGSEFQLALRSMSDLHVLNEVLVARIYDVPALRSATRVVDAGGNIGAATLYFKARRPSARVVTVEPDPEAFRQLERNTGALHGVSLHRCALACESAEATLYSSPQSWRSSLVARERARAVTVRTTSLGDLLDACGMDRVDLLKLDIEGGEFDVLRDAGGLARVDALIAELHFDAGNEASLSEVRRWLEAFEVAITETDPSHPTLYAVRRGRGDGGAPVTGRS